MPWQIWRLVMAQKATYSEIENHWDICILMEANEALDIIEDLEAEAQSRASKGRG